MTSEPRIPGAAGRAGRGDGALPTVPAPASPRGPAPSAPPPVLFYRDSQKSSRPHAAKCFVCRARYVEVPVPGQGARGHCDKCYGEIEAELARVRGIGPVPQVRSGTIRPTGYSARGRRSCRGDAPDARAHKAHYPGNRRGRFPA